MLQALDLDLVSAWLDQADDRLAGEPSPQERQKIEEGRAARLKHIERARFTDAALDILRGAQAFDELFRPFD